MTSVTPVVVFPPAEKGGRRVYVGDEALGIAYSVQDLVGFLQNAGLEGWDDLDVVNWDGIDWRGGGPGVWER